MSVRAVLSYLPVSLLALPVAALGQLPCTTGSPSLQVAISPTDIAPGQPFTVQAQVCPAPASSLPVQITATGLPSPYPGTVTQTVNTNANGLASLYVGGGLPAYAPGYSVQAAIPAPPGVPGNTYASGIIYVGGGPLSSAFKGQYTFLVQGVISPTRTGDGLKGAVAGSFVADGQGAVTSGVVDVNTAAGVETRLPVTGRYTIFDGTSGTRPYGGTITFQIAGGTYGGTLNLSGEGALGSVSSTGALSLASGVIGSGTLALQALPALGSPGNSGIAVVSGESACTASCRQSGGTVQAISGQFAVGYGSQIQQGPNGGSFPVILQGTETIGTTTKTFFDYELSVGIDSNGRELLGSSYVEYLVDATHAYLLSLNPHSTSDLLSGFVTLVPPSN